MLDFLPLVILSLVTFRVTRFVVGDTLIEGWRERFKDWAFMPDHETPRPVASGSIFWTNARGKLGELLTCPFCVSVHIAGWTYLAYVLDRGGDATSVLEHLLNWIAVAGATIVIWNVGERAVTAEVEEAEAATAANET